ncbi:MAG: folate-binding protein YgfZ [Ramlibacter sp.]|nr:folate-binding protein YgfZ [Ramlibacter sp.]
MTHALNGKAALTHLGVIRVEGGDAASFLQGQLTQDFLLLKPGQARLAAFCSAKGRMQASFIGLKRADDILLVCCRDLLATTLKRLSMFVLRAKAKLSDATGEFALFGLAGEAWQAVQSGAPLAEPWACGSDGQAHWVALYPAMGQPRGLWVGPGDASAPQGPVLSLEEWLWSEVRSGVATLSQPLVDAFVPQMLNYESVGGVSFKKGCYPGQEVVARSQFRGTLKRRAFIAHADGPLAAGQEVFQAGDSEQPCGLVVQAEAAPGGGYDALVSLQLSAVDHRLSAATPEGPALTLLPLPYLLAADV